MASITFYHDFRREPAGRHVVKICRAESCQAMNGETLCNHAKASLKAGFGETTADGQCDARSRLLPRQLCACRRQSWSTAICMAASMPERFDEIMDETLKEAAQ